MTERDYKDIAETLCLVAKNAAEIQDYSGFKYIIEQNLRIAWLEGYGTAKAEKED